MMRYDLPPGSGRTWRSTELPPAFHFLVRHFVCWLGLPSGLPLGGSQ